MIQAIAIILSGVFMAIGGWHILLVRRIGIPILLTGVCIYITHSWLALTALSAYGFLCLGYGEHSWFRHCFGDGWGRGVWGFLVALSLSLWAVCSGHTTVWLFLAYLAVGFTLENALKKLPQIIGDICIGAGFGLISLIVR